MLCVAVLRVIFFFSIGLCVGINSGIGTNVRSAWDALIDDECAKALAAAVSLYKGTQSFVWFFLILHSVDNMNECAKQMPLDVKELLEEHDKNASLARAEFHEYVL